MNKNVIATEYNKNNNASNILLLYHHLIVKSEKYCIKKSSRYSFVFYNNNKV
jgi:hypothetical protein